MEAQKIGYETVVKYVPETIIKQSDFAYLDDLVAELPDHARKLFAPEVLPDEVRALKDKDATEIMAVGAARKALEASGLQPSDIDFIIASNCGGKQLMPMVGTHIHHALGFNVDTPVLNVMDACAGFLDASNVAWSLVKSGAYKRVLIVVATSQFADEGQRVDRTTPLAKVFGDGAGAAIVSGENLKCEFLAYHHETYGNAYQSGFQTIKELENPHLAEKAGVEVKAGAYFSLGDFSMVEKLDTEELLVDSLRKTLPKAGLELSDVDMVIAHHIGAESSKWIKGLVDAGVNDHVYQNLLKKYGNMAVADLAVDLAEFWEEGRLSNGSIVALWVPASGIQMPTLILRWLV
ncbi:3-oxoacyl-ACP synthase III family protein [Paraburkholderia caffeinilytica]|uniref:3-oxoacyl-ACP synthase III family protein n=1 Tax=Paraburkholderia caffeinilytica TaxID=1761016 RepID=UPI003DA0BDE4